MLFELAYTPLTAQDRVTAVDVLRSPAFAITTWARSQLRRGHNLGLNKMIVTLINMTSIQYR